VDLSRHLNAVGVPVAGYDKGMDDELQQVFNLMVSRGINLFDTADSYGADAPLDAGGMSKIMRASMAGSRC
jgi:aryl-alcohol dehydrogenase-like predicted oxidoreductase